MNFLQLHSRNEKIVYRIEDYNGFSLEQYINKERGTVSMLNENYFVRTELKGEGELVEICSVQDENPIINWNDSNLLLYHNEDGIFIFQNNENLDIFKFDSKKESIIWKKEKLIGTTNLRLIKEQSDCIIFEKIENISNGYGYNVEWFSLNISTGNIAWKLKNAGADVYKNEKDELFYIKYGDSELGAHVNSELRKVNTEDGTYKSFPIAPEFFADNFFSASEGVIYGNLLFVRRYVGRILRIYDFVKQEVVQTLKVLTPEEEKHGYFETNFNQPVVTENRIYITDQKINTYIFERFNDKKNTEI